MRLIDAYEISESPWREVKVATGRAACRVCGQRIAKGDQELKFAASFTDGSYNAWTAVECHAHLNCALPQHRTNW